MARKRLKWKKTSVIVGGALEQKRTKTTLSTKKKVVLVGVFLIAAILIGVLGSYGYRKWEYRGKINPSTYSWPKTEKGNVLDVTAGMSNQQKADYYYTVGYEFMNKKEPDAALAAFRVSIQFSRSVRALDAAGRASEQKGDYDGAIVFYKQEVDILNQQKPINYQILVTELERHIESVQNRKKNPPKPQEQQIDPTKVGA